MLIRIRKKTKFNKINWGIFACALLGYSIHPLFTIIVVSLLIFNISNGKSMMIGNKISFILLIVIFLLFSIISVYKGLNTINNAIWLSSNSVLFYILGSNFSKRCNDNMACFLFFFLALVLAIPHIPITILDIFQNGLVNPERTIGIEDEQQRAVTQRTVELALAISLVGLVFEKPKPLFKSTIQIWSILLAILAELCTLHYLSRTGIALLVISIIVGSLFNLKNYLGNLIIIILGCLLLWIFWDTSLYSAFSEREIEGSSLLDFGGRSILWSLGLSMLFENPMGYESNDFIHYAHNFWLDFGKHGGLPSFILLVIFSILLLIKTFKIEKHAILSKLTRHIIFIYSIIFLVTLFTEPIHEGAPLFMYVYFMYAGFCFNLKFTNIPSKIKREKRTFLLRHKRLHLS